MCALKSLNQFKSMIIWLHHINTASYLPSSIAASFCRGLRTINIRGAGRAFMGAEVWKWRPHLVRAGAQDTGNVRSAPIWKHTVRPFPPNKTCAPIAVELNWAELVWKLMNDETEHVFFAGRTACLQIRKFRDRCTLRKERRLFLKTLRQSKDIVITGNRTPHAARALNIYISQRRNTYHRSIRHFLTSPTSVSFPALLTVLSCQTQC